MTAARRELAPNSLMAIVVPHSSHAGCCATVTYVEAPANSPDATVATNVAIVMFQLPVMSVYRRARQPRRRRLPSFDFFDWPRAFVGRKRLAGRRPAAALCSTA